jgi:hypothetical protein
MPIVFLSPDCKNRKIHEIKDVVPEFDLVFISTSSQSSDLCDYISREIDCPHIYVTEKLDMENCSFDNFNWIIQRINLKVGSVLIIADQAYFNNLKNNFIKDEWEVLSFDDKEKFW